jgi:hypothetical protein
MSVKKPKEIGSVWVANPTNTKDWIKISSEYTWVDEKGEPTKLANQKLNPAPIKYVKQAKAMAYGFALMLGKDVDVVGCNDGKYEYDLFIEFDVDHDEGHQEWRWAWPTVTPQGAKQRALRMIKKEEQK